MGIEDKSPMLLVGEQEIEGDTLRDRLKNIFNNSLNAADLTPAEKRLVIDSFMTKAERAISHRAQARESGGYFDRGLINWALSEAQSQIDQLIIDREKLSDSKKSEKRLCPELAGKTKTELD